MISLKVRGHSWGHCEDGHILSAFVMWPLLLCLHVHHLLFMKHFSVTALVLGILKPLFLHAVMNAVTEVDHQTCSEKSVGRYHGYGTKLCREVCCLLKAYRRPSTQHNGPTCLIQAEPWGRRWWWCWEWEATAPKAPVTTHTYRHIYGNISGEGLGLEVFILKKNISSPEYPVSSENLLYVDSAPPVGQHECAAEGEREREREVCLNTTISSHCGSASVEILNNFKGN